MVLSKRERILAIVTAVVVAALAVNTFVVEPVSRRLEQVENEKQQLLAQVNEAQSLFDRRRLLDRKWKEMLSDGLQDDAEVESRVARSLDEWSGRSGLTVTSVRPERVAGEKGLKEIVFAVAGRGSLNAVVQFLCDVQTTKLPLKVKNMQLSSANDSGDDMSLQLGLSALYLGAEDKPAEKQPQSKPQEDSNEEQLL
jgi:Tfp pilus assembly protein PilO